MPERLLDRAALAAWCRQFSPLVAVDETAWPDSLLLDITGLEHLFGSEAQLAQRLARGLARRGVYASLAIADTPGAAWAVGSSNRGLPPTAISLIPNPSSPVTCNLSPVTSIIPPGETLAALAELPIAALRVPDDVIDLLEQLGIQRIGQLEGLPREEWSVRFGPQLLLRWDQALGRAPEPLPDYQTPPELHAQCTLENPVSQQEAVEHLLHTLLEQVSQKLTAHGLGALRLECRLTLVDADPRVLSLGLFQPTTAAKHLLGLAQLQLERQALPGPVAALQVEVLQTGPLVQRQQELFADDPPRRHPRHVAALIDRLSSRIGPRAVLRARLVADAQPELACTYDTLVGHPRRARAAARALPAELPPRPLRLLPRPVPVAMVSLPPDGPPVQFQLHGHPQQVVWTWGPERIQTGWWRNRLVGRDYYRIETTTGHRLWLFRRLRDGQWFVHGAFG